jgi:hypothetical protein
MPPGFSVHHLAYRYVVMASTVARSDVLVPDPVGLTVERCYFEVVDDITCMKVVSRAASYVKR